MFRQWSMTRAIRFAVRGCGAFRRRCERVLPQSVRIHGVSLFPFDAVRFPGHPGGREKPFSRAVRLSPKQTGGLPAPETGAQEERGSCGSVPLLSRLFSFFRFQLKQFKRKHIVPAGAFRQRQPLVRFRRIAVIHHRKVEPEKLMFMESFFH